MPTKSLILAAAVCLSTTAAQALDTVQCGLIEAQAFTVLDFEYNIEVTQSPTSTAHALPNGCASSNLDIYVEEVGLMFRAERLVFTGENLTQWVSGDVILPTQLQLRLDGVTLTDRFMPTPDLAWVRDLVGPDQPAQIDLQWTWVEATQQLTVDFARIDFQNNNDVTLQLTGTALGWAPYTTPSSDFAADRISLVASFNGLFEQAVAAPLIANGVDMSPFTLAFMAAGVQNLVLSAPPSLLSRQSGADIVAFSQTLPNPRGRLQIALASPTPFFPERVLEDLRGGVPFAVATPQGFNMDVRWTPSN